MIYKTWFGKHIDLSKVVSISSPYQIDHRGHIGFKIYCQLLENPIVHRTFFQWNLDNGYELKEKELQQKINELVEVWKKFKENSECSECINYQTEKSKSTKCPSCESSNVWQKGHLLACDDCGHEWSL